MPFTGSVHGAAGAHAIALGDALYQALGNKRGIERYGYALPMDDCMCTVALDFGGRPWLVWNADFKREKVGDMPTDMFLHFFKSLSDAAKMNLNIQAEAPARENEIHQAYIERLGADARDRRGGEDHDSAEGGGAPPQEGPQRRREEGDARRHRGRGGELHPHGRQDRRARRGELRDRFRGQHRRVPHAREGHRAARREPGGADFEHRQIGLAVDAQADLLALALQVARNLTDAIDGVLRGTRYLIHDRDPLFTREFVATRG